MSSNAQNAADQEWVDYFLPRAEAGDPEAQIAIGWEYVRGTLFQKDVKKAEEWFRRAEPLIGEAAIFHLMRMLYIERDMRIEEIFAARDEWSLGSIYFVYAAYVGRKGDRESALQYLRKGEEKGHLYAALQRSRLTYRWPFKRLLAFPREVAIAAKAGWIKSKDPDDPRVLDGYRITLA